MAEKVYSGDVFKCNICNMEIRVIKAGEETSPKEEPHLFCCGQAMEKVGGLDPANSW